MLDDDQEIIVIILLLWFRCAYRRINSWQAGDRCKVWKVGYSGKKDYRCRKCWKWESQTKSRNSSWNLWKTKKRTAWKRYTSLNRKADRGTRCLKNLQSTQKPHDSKTEPDQTPERTDGKGKTLSKGKCKYRGNQMHRKRQDCPAFG